MWLLCMFLSETAVACVFEQETGMCRYRYMLKLDLFVYSSSDYRNPVVYYSHFLQLFQG